MPRSRAPKPPAADAPLPRRLNGPSQTDPWLEQKKHELKATGGTQCYLLTDIEGLQMIAAGLNVEHGMDQARRALEWLGTERGTP